MKPQSSSKQSRNRAARRVRRLGVEAELQKPLQQGTATRFGHGVDGRRGAVAHGVSDHSMEMGREGHQPDVKALERKTYSNSYSAFFIRLYK